MKKTQAKASKVSKPKTKPQPKARAFVDTIGEGAGVYSRLIELGYKNATSAKYSERASELTDVTGQYTFAVTL